MIQDTNSD